MTTPTSRCYRCGETLPADLPEDSAQACPHCGRWIRPDIAREMAAGTRAWRAIDGEKDLQPDLRSQLRTPLERRAQELWRMADRAEAKAQGTPAPATPSPAPAIPERFAPPPLPPFTSVEPTRPAPPPPTSRFREVWGRIGPAVTQNLLFALAIFLLTSGAVFALTTAWTVMTGTQRLVALFLGLELFIGLTVLARRGCRRLGDLDDVEGALAMVGALSIPLTTIASALIVRLNVGLGLVAAVISLGQGIVLLRATSLRATTSRIGILLLASGPLVITGLVHGFDDFKLLGADGAWHPQRSLLLGTGFVSCALLVGFGAHVVRRLRQASVPSRNWSAYIPLILLSMAAGATVIETAIWSLEPTRIKLVPLGLVLSAAALLLERVRARLESDRKPSAALPLLGLAVAGTGAVLAGPHASSLLLALSACTALALSAAARLRSTSLWMIGLVVSAFAYLMLPAPVRELAEWARERFAQRLGYEPEQVPLSFYGLTFLPYLIGVGLWERLASRREDAIGARSLFRWSLLLGGLLAAMSITLGDDARAPAMVLAGLGTWTVIHSVWSQRAFGLGAGLLALIASWASWLAYEEPSPERSALWTAFIATSACAASVATSRMRGGFAAQATRLLAGATALLGLGTMLLALPPWGLRSEDGLLAAAALGLVAVLLHIASWASRLSLLSALSVLAMAWAGWWIGLPDASDSWWLGHWTRTAAERADLIAAMQRLDMIGFVRSSGAELLLGLSLALPWSLLLRLTSARVAHADDAPQSPMWVAAVIGAGTSACAAIGAGAFELRTLSLSRNRLLGDVAQSRLDEWLTWIRPELPALLATALVLVASGMVARSRMFAWIGALSLPIAASAALLLWNPTYALPMVPFVASAVSCLFLPGIRRATGAWILFALAALATSSLNLVPSGWATACLAVVAPLACWAARRQPRLRTLLLVGTTLIVAESFGVMSLGLRAPWPSSVWLVALSGAGLLAQSRPRWLCPSSVALLTVPAWIASACVVIIWAAQRLHGNPVEFHLSTSPWTLWVFLASFIAAGWSSMPEPFRGLRLVVRTASLVFAGVAAPLLTSFLRLQLGDGEATFGIRTALETTSGATFEWLAVALGLAWITRRESIGFGRASAAYAIAAAGLMTTSGLLSSASTPLAFLLASFVPAAFVWRRSRGPHPELHVAAVGLFAFTALQWGWMHKGVSVESGTALGLPADWLAWAALACWGVAGVAAVVSRLGRDAVKTRYLLASGAFLLLAGSALLLDALFAETDLIRNGLLASQATAAAVTLAVGSVVVLALRVAWITPQRWFGAAAPLSLGVLVGWLSVLTPWLEPLDGHQPLVLEVIGLGLLLLGLARAPSSRLAYSALALLVPQVALSLGVPSVTDGVALIVAAATLGIASWTWRSAAVATAAGILLNVGLFTCWRSQGWMDLSLYGLPAGLTLLVGGWMMRDSMSRIASSSLVGLGGIIAYGSLLLQVVRLGEPTHALALFACALTTLAIGVRWRMPVALIGGAVVTVFDVVAYLIAHQFEQDFLGASLLVASGACVLAAGAITARRRRQEAKPTSPS